ncbi:MAG: FHA domain-containing protein, partial [Anaerolineae bacterium]|nr:FHA domain-containing protein [Anaerolineae bacterium]
MTDNQLNVLYCPRCGHSNALQATRCAECGLVFPSTIPVDDLVPDAQPVTSLEKPSEKAQLEQAGTIVFSIAGHDRPLFVRRQTEIVLGRSAPGEATPTVDLNAYRGQKMGVSRRHALIRLSDEQALIEDLGSVNGTWLNENKLEPRQPHKLRNGDYLRLGHLIMVIHASAIDTLILIDTDKRADKRLTTTVLVEQVGPFLSAITDLQNAINELSGQKAAPVTVHSMNAGAKGAIHVRLSGATETLDLLREEVMPWRRRHIKLLNDTKMLNNPAQSQPQTDHLPPETPLDQTQPTQAQADEPERFKTQPTRPGQTHNLITSPAANSLQPNITPPPAIDPAAHAREVQSRFHNAYRMLFKNVLDRIAAGKDETLIAAQRASLTIALNQLAFNPLEMSDSSVSG